MMRAVWETGSMDVRDFELFVTPEAVFYCAASTAGVVMSNADVEYAVAALRCGKYSMSVVGSAQREEHLDDHRVQIVSELSQSGAVVRDPDRASTDDLAVLCRRP
jgi:UDP-N-acetylglucosamine transferase subunit ALG13